METLLVRLKAYDPRRGNVLRRFTYRGIKFHEERGWYRVEPAVGHYLREVRQVLGDEHSPLAFDVRTDDEARELDGREKDAATTRKAASDEIRLSAAREEGAVPALDLGDGPHEENRAGRKPRKG